MFIDFVDFSKKERSEYWHFKLQNFVLGKVPYQENFCPYFWLTIVSLILFIPFSLIKYVLIKGIGKGLWLILHGVFIALDFIFEKLAEGIDKTVCDPYYNYYAERMDDQKLVETYEYINNYHIGSSGNKSFVKATVLFDTWKSKAGDNWKDKLDRAIEDTKKREKEKEDILLQLRQERYERERIRDEKAAAIEKRIKNAYGTIINITKIVAPIIGIILAIGIVYCLIMFFIWLVPIIVSAIASIPWITVGEAILFLLKWIGIGLAVLTPVALFAFGIYKLGCIIRQKGECILCKRIGKIFKPIFRFIGSIFSFFGRKLAMFGTWLFPIFPGIGNLILIIIKAIVDVTRFFWTGFMGWKKENCPQMRWKS